MATKIQGICLLSCKVRKIVVTVILGVVFWWSSTSAFVDLTCGEREIFFFCLWSLHLILYCCTSFWKVQRTLFNFKIVNMQISPENETTFHSTSFPGSLLSASLGRWMFLQRPREAEKRDPGNEVVFHCGDMCRSEWWAQIFFCPRRI